jgi:hypothetical protein
VPLPTVTGPIPVTATSHPMNAATFELKPEVCGIAVKGR